MIITYVSGTVIIVKFSATDNLFRINYGDISNKVIKYTQQL